MYTHVQSFVDITDVSLQSDEFDYFNKNKNMTNSHFLVLNVMCGPIASGQQQCVSRSE